MYIEFARTLVLIIFITHVVLDAWGDAFRYFKRYFFSHLFEALQVLCLLFLLYVQVEPLSILYLIVAYGCIRFALFDPIYNVSIKQNIMYIGDTSLYDKILGKIFNTPTKKSLMMGLRMVFLILGFWLIQYVINF